MKKEIGIRPTTEQKYFKFLTYIYSKTQTPTILKSAQLSFEFGITPGALVALKTLGVLEYEKDKSNRRYTKYKWAKGKPSRKMAIEVIKEVRPKKQKDLENKNGFIPFEPNFSKREKITVIDVRKGAENSNENPIFCKKIKNGEVEVKPIKSKKTQPIKKEEKTAVNISLFWGLFKITLKK